MQLARVIGEVVATMKDPNLSGNKLLVLQPIAADGQDVGRTLVALDSVGAGVGEEVFFVRGREAAFPFYPAEPPTDAAVVGIVDSRDIEPPRTEYLSRDDSPAARTGPSGEVDRAKPEGRRSKQGGGGKPDAPGRRDADR